MCQVGEHQHRLAHQCSPCKNFAHTWSVKLNIIRLWEWAIYSLMGGAFITWWVWHLWLKWVGLLCQDCQEFITIRVCNSHIYVFHCHLLWSMRCKQSAVDMVSCVNTVVERLASLQCLQSLCTLARLAIMLTQKQLQQESIWALFHMHITPDLFFI